MRTFEPFQRGYFANDASLKYPFHSSTVKSIYLYTVTPIIAVLIVSFEPCKIAYLLQIVATELIRARSYGFKTRYKHIPLV